MAECARPDCGGQALTDADFCRHHVDDEPDPPTADTEAYERKAIDTLVGILEQEDRRGPRMRAAEALLLHARESE